MNKNELKHLNALSSFLMDNLSYDKRSKVYEILKQLKTEKLDQVDLKGIKTELELIPIKNTNMLTLLTTKEYLTIGKKTHKMSKTLDYLYFDWFTKSEILVPRKDFFKPFNQSQKETQLISEADKKVLEILFKRLIMKKDKFEELISNTEGITYDADSYDEKSDILEQDAYTLSTDLYTFLKINSFIEEIEVNSTWYVFATINLCRFFQKAESDYETEKKIYNDMFLRLEKKVYMKARVKLTAYMAYKHFSKIDVELHNSKLIKDVIYEYKDGTKNQVLNVSTDDLMQIRTYINSLEGTDRLFINTTESIILKISEQQDLFHRQLIYIYIKDNAVRSVIRTSEGFKSYNFRN